MGAGSRATLLAATLAACSCAPLRQQLARTVDVVVRVGPGLGARLSITSDAQLGALAIGTSERSSQIVPELNHAVGWRGGELVHGTEHAVEYGVSPWYRASATRGPDAETTAAAEVDLKTERAASLSAGVHLALIGIEVAVDFLAIGRSFAILFGAEPDADQ